jgi:hypothetical protein
MNAWLNLKSMKVIQLTFSIAVIALIVGCQTYPAPVSDLAAGKQLLQSALSEWKSGTTWEQMKQRTPPVYVAEELWMDDFKLSDFVIDGEGELYGSNVRLRATLTGVDKSGRKAEHRLTYLVTTTPALTIARDDR